MSNSHDDDLLEVVKYVNQILARGEGVTSFDLIELVIEGIKAGRIDSHGCPAEVRADSLRRRFHDLCAS
jgi:hypothetical protein